MQEITVRRYESFSEISKDDFKMEDEKINSNNVMSVFQDIFCNNPFQSHLKAPIWVNLRDLYAAIYEFQKGEKRKESWWDLDKKAAHYEQVFKYVKRLMPYLLVAENPNKFLKLALETRKACLEGKKLSMFKPGVLEDVIIGSGSDVTNPLDRFYIGLDQVAQFLNFCVMIRQIPTKEGQEIKNIDQIEKLSFDRNVLKEFVDQYNQEYNLVQELIGKQDMEKYRTQLKDLRVKYNNYRRAMINGNSPYDLCQPFSQWISRKDDFVERFVRAWDNGPWIGVYNDGPNEGKVIDDKDKNIDKKKVKKGYHNGGGITDNDELTKLLKLDAILQAGKAINKFIDTKAVDESTLNWFQNLWNDLVRGTWIANKLGWFFREKKGEVELRDNQFIPTLEELDECENQKTKHGLNKE